MLAQDPGNVWAFAHLFPLVRKVRHRSWLALAKRYDGLASPGGAAFDRRFDAAAEVAELADSLAYDYLALDGLERWPAELPSVIARVERARSWPGAAPSEWERLTYAVLLHLSERHGEALEVLPALTGRQRDDFGLSGGGWMVQRLDRLRSVLPTGLTERALRRPPSPNRPAQSPSRESAEGALDRLSAALASGRHPSVARLAWSEPIRPAVVAGLEHRFHLRFPQAYCQLLLTRGVPRLALKATRHDDAGTQALIPPSDLPRARRMALSWFETRSDFDASFGHLVPFQFTKGRGDPDVFVFDPRRPTRAGEPSVRLLRHDDASASPSRPSFTTHCRGWVNALLAQFD